MLGRPDSSQSEWLNPKLHPSQNSGALEAQNGAGGSVDQRSQIRIFIMRNPHESEKMDLDPHFSYADPQPCPGSWTVTVYISVSPFLFCIHNVLSNAQWRSCCQLFYSVGIRI
jgi:hypothetical protein